MSGIRRTRDAPARRLAPRAALCWLALVLLQWPLAANPGYFSHDELQWAVRAVSGGASPWLETGAFQYRPLTFSIWMGLSRLLFDTPAFFHVLLVGWGSGNAMLAWWLARGFGQRGWPPVIGAAVFALGPFAAWTHGWVGCIADLAWVSLALVLALIVQRSTRLLTAATAAIVLTAAALLAKEAAVSIAPLLLLAAWLDRPRRRAWLAAAVASGFAMGLWLGWRWDALLHAPRQGGQYALALANVPRRWLEYQVFAPLVPVLEIGGAFRRAVPIAIAGLLSLAALVSVWRASRRAAAVLLLGGTAALLPVLPLGASWNHYGYAYALVASMAAAAAWPAATRSGRVVIAVAALLAVAHGSVVAWRMHDVGRIQSRFSPAVARELRAVGPGEVLRLRVVPGGKEWIFRRLLHDVPAYDGVPFAGRVILVEGEGPCDLAIAADGRLVDGCR